MKRYRVKVYMAWWWPIYTNGVIFFATITGAFPDLAKVVHMGQLAVRTRIVVVKSEGELKA